MPRQVADRVIAIVALRVCSDTSTGCVLLGDCSSALPRKRHLTGASAMSPKQA
jgi:hypothetical protein